MLQLANETTPLLVAIGCKLDLARVSDDQPLPGTLELMLEVRGDVTLFDSFEKIGDSIQMATP